MYQIFAVEPAKDVTDLADYVFDQTYCQAMKLPFRTGWHHWCLFRRDRSTLTHIADFDTYEGAEAFLNALLAHPLHDAAPVAEVEIQVEPFLTWSDEFALELSVTDLDGQEQGIQCPELLSIILAKHRDELWGLALEKCRDFVHSCKHFST